VEHEAVEDGGDTKKGEERERVKERNSLRKRRARFRAWLCSIILLLYLPCLRHDGKKGRKRVSAGILLFPRGIPVNMTVETPSA